MSEHETATPYTEQSQESRESLHWLTHEELADVRAAGAELLAELHRVRDGDIIAEIVINALKLLRDRTHRGDLKLLHRSMRELRYALRIFAPYQDTRKVSVFGSARTPETHEDYIQAVAFSRGMAEQGWMVITGAAGGIMSAGNEGAGADPSFGLAIRLPFEIVTNPTIAEDPKLIHFRYFFTRKLMFLRASHAIALFPGGFGTLDEAFESLTLVQTGKSVPTPIVFVDRPGGDFWLGMQKFIDRYIASRGLISETDRCLYKITDDAAEAVREITHFYSNYHSIRYVPDGVVLRLQRRPTEEQLAQIEEEFADIKVSGAFRTGDALPIESDEPSLAHLPRLIFDFNRRDQDRLRMLIDFLNDLPPNA